MRIAYIGNAESTHIHHWAETFGKDHEVHVLSQNAPSSFQYTNAQVHVIEPPLARAPAALFPAKWLLFRRHVRRTLQGIRPDLVHQIGAAHHLFSGTVPAGVPYLVAVMGTDVFQEPFASTFRHKMIERTLQKADGVLYQSRYTGKHLRDTFALPAAKRIHMPWGIDAEMFLGQNGAKRPDIRSALGIPPGNQVVLSPRFLSPNYNVPRIIDAFCEIARQDPDPHLVLLRGSSSETDVQETLHHVRRKGLDERVTLVDRFLAKPELAALMATSDTFVSLPYTDQFAMTILEGMAAGSFPILTRNPVYEEYLADGETALFVDPDDPDGLVAALTRALEDDTLRKTARRRNRETVALHEDERVNLARAAAFYAMVAGKEMRFTPIRGAKPSRAVQEIDVRAQ